MGWGPSRVSQSVLKLDVYCFVLIMFIILGSRRESKR